jgi:hypothetical protein
VLHEDVVKQVEKIWAYFCRATFDYGSEIGYRGLFGGWF